MHKNKTKILKVNEKLKAKIQKGGKRGRCLADARHDRQNVIPDLIGDLLLLSFRT
jgi:hypothetical protein